MGTVGTLASEVIVEGVCTLLSFRRLDGIMAI